MFESPWGEWAWENRDKISFGITAPCRWLWAKRGETRSEPAEGGKPEVLVLGPGGVGKSTLGYILSGKLDLLLDPPGPYDESLDLEKFNLEGAPGVEILVPPGQVHRREATWTSELQKLAAGEFRGMILVGAFGFHNHEIGPMRSYKDHRLFRGNKDEFLRAFLQDRRNEELKVLRELSPKITPPPGGKFWLLTLVTKQDLWWDERAAAESFYSAGEYAAEIARIQGRHGAGLFRHELALCSLVISNFETGKGELLKPNTAGYDHRHYVLSLRKMLEKLEALRRWEEGQ